jgi:flagellar protein FlbT
MALKITLKPNERMIIGSAVIKNGSKRTDFWIENEVAILREKDILSEKEAQTSPCRRIYFVIQLMYINEENLAAHHALYWQLVQDVIGAAPSTAPLINRISKKIVNREYYQALKLAKNLIDYEQEIISRASESIECLQNRG